MSWVHQKEGCTVRISVAVVDAIVTKDMIICHSAGTKQFISQIMIPD
jgi:hypothetical protein